MFSETLSTHKLPWPKEQAFKRGGGILYALPFPQNLAIFYYAIVQVEQLNMKYVCVCGQSVGLLVNNQTTVSNKQVVAVSTNNKSTALNLVSSLCFRKRSGWSR